MHETADLFAKVLMFGGVLSAASADTDTSVFRTSTARFVRTPYVVPANAGRLVERSRAHLFKRSGGHMQRGFVALSFRV
jgi:hypothetical protein